MGADLSFTVWLAIVALVVYFRLLRPIRLRASRLWLGPALMAVLAVLLAWGSSEGHASTAAILLAIAAGGVLGVPFGLLRGRHTRVRGTGNPRVLVVEPSVVPLAVWSLAFAARVVLRVFLPRAGPSALAASDGFLAFAVASLVGARLVIARKFKELHAS